ncbi:alpha-1,6-mannosyl-glycoprotein 2-beta-N-acetylglucosaminyltransferase-like isoform X2 [Patella vulgata]|nr:alpha-1,6-mannosyl-glycoprotein 2-beta-N-acetylglucosaminyltransferase-like isoform X2 [Patella vulgata]
MIPRIDEHKFYKLLCNMVRFSTRRFLISLATLWAIFTVGFFYKQLSINANNPFISKDTWSGLLPRNIKWSSVKYDLNDTEHLHKIFGEVNKLQYIRNQQYTLDLSDSGIVILVQVHDREKELKILVDSLRNVKDIENTLVIFSHDLFLPNINDVIEDIEFCSVMQIFFPHALQIKKNQFPADSMSDCPRDIGPETAKIVGCSNADHPDLYGHYREAKFSQMKHHWTWKINYVFNDIRLLKHFKGLVLRIDNDYYLGPDILRVMRMMNQHKIIHGLDINKMLIMGDYEEFKNEYRHDSDMFTSGYWYTGIGRGMGFNRDLWQKISNCKNIFCTFDDYNWDWSLQKLIDTCFNGLLVLKPIISRIFHVGKCHGFHRENICSMDEVLLNIKNFLNINQQYMYPQEMVYLVKKTPVRKVSDQVGNGGWADPRDHNLCLSFFKNRFSDSNV